MKTFKQLIKEANTNVFDKDAPATEKEYQDVLTLDKAEKQWKNNKNITKVERVTPYSFNIDFVGRDPRKGTLAVFRQQNYKFRVTYDTQDWPNLEANAVAGAVDHLVSLVSKAGKK